MKNSTKKGFFILLMSVLTGARGEHSVLDTIQKYTKRFGPDFTYVCIKATEIDALQPQVCKSKQGPIRYIGKNKEADFVKLLDRSFHELNHKEALAECSSDQVLFKLSDQGYLRGRGQGKSVRGPYKKERLQPYFMMN